MLLVSHCSHSSLPPLRSHQQESEQDPGCGSVGASFLTRFPCACSGKQISGQNCFQRLRSLHMKSWIIAALICSTSAAYAAEDDNKIHPTCVEENNTRRCWVDHWPPAGVRPPQLQPVAPAPQAAIPPTAPTMVPVSPPARWLPPPLSSGSDRMG